MRHVTATALLAAFLTGSGVAQRAGTEKVDEPRQKADDFQREGDAKARKRKDPLEGKAPPPLQVTRWMNIEGKSLSLSALRGKVIAIKFWGVW